MVLSVYLVDFSPIRDFLYCRPVSECLFWARHCSVLEREQGIPLSLVLYVDVINDGLVAPLDQKLLEGKNPAEPAPEALSAQQACSLSGVQGKGTELYQAG